MTAPSAIELTCTGYEFGFVIVAATSAEVVGYRLLLGVPAEIVSD